MAILTEPPVHPFSDPEEIRTWIERLRQMYRTRYHDDSARVVIEERIAEALGWLRFRGFAVREDPLV